MLMFFGVFIIAASTLIIITVSVFYVFFFLVCGHSRHVVVRRTSRDDVAGMVASG
jgi:hypothetical protein